MTTQHEEISVALPMRLRGIADAIDDGQHWLAGVGAETVKLVLNDAAEVLSGMDDEPLAARYEEKCANCGRRFGDHSVDGRCPNDGFRQQTTFQRAAIEPVPWQDACDARGGPYPEAQCVAERGHHGTHRSLDGTEWPETPEVPRPWSLEQIRAAVWWLIDQKAGRP